MKLGDEEGDGSMVLRKVHVRWMLLDAFEKPRVVLACNVIDDVDWDSAAISLLAEDTKSCEQYIVHVCISVDETNIRSGLL